MRAAALAFALVLAGCGGGASCEELCDAKRACGENVGDDCLAQCQGSRDQADAVGCGSEYDDLASCSLDEGLCNGPGASPCSDQLSDVLGCLVEKCEADPPPAACKSSADTPG